MIGGGIGPKRYVRPPLGTAAGDLLVFNGSTWEAQAATSIGTLDHAALTGGLPWASSGHTGTANRLARVATCCGLAACKPICAG